MNLTFNEILSCLTVVSRTGNTAQAICPCHDDKNASLTVTDVGDKVLLHCHAGCSFESIMAAIKTGHADVVQSNPSKNGVKKTKTLGSIIAEYSYADENGQELFQCVRYEPKDFRQRHKVNGRWIYNLQGVRRVLFRLPEILKAVRDGRPLFVCEGEKDVLSLERLGFAATCNPMGAGKWRDEYSTSLKDANAVILPDNDKAGKEHARKVAESLRSHAKSVKIIELPQLKEKGDVTDWIEAGGTAKKLQTLADEPEYEKRTNELPPTVARIEEYLKSKYEFRFNEVSRHIEIRREETIWKAIDERELASIERELMWAKMPTRGLFRLINSDFTPVFNPFKNYFSSLPRWDGTDWITEFADTVRVNNSEQQLWREYFKKWLVAMVAGLINDEAVNHTMLVLAGAQGVGKTTWLENILPETLKNYRFTGSVNPTDKDAKIMLSDKALINLDEFETMSRHEIGLLKSMITLSKITTRRPYDRMHQDDVRRASFVASINDLTFLSDSTGSRRFLPIEVESIDLDASKRFNKELLYSHSLALYKTGFRYWFESEEIQAVNERNERFALAAVEEELLLQYFKRPSKGEDSLFMTSTEIAGYLAEKEKWFKPTKSSIRDTGKALKKLGYERKAKKTKEEGKTTTVYGYTVKKIIIEPLPDETIPNVF